jgi:hypothetical protein
MSEMQTVTASSSAAFIPASIDLRSYVPKDLRPGLAGGIYVAVASIGSGRCDGIDSTSLALSGKVTIPGKGEHDIDLRVRMTGPNRALVTAAPLFVDKPATVTPESGKLRFDLEQPVPATPITLWFTDRNFFQGAKLGFDFHYGVPLNAYFWFDKA